MKIAVVCSYYPWPPSVGGVETIVRNVSTQLVKRGHEVYVVTTPFDVTTMKQVSEYGIEEKYGVIVYKLRPGKLKIGYARFIKNLKEVIKDIKPELVHAHSLHPHLLQLALWKEEIGYKLVAELHHPAIELDFLVQNLAMPFAIQALKLLSKNIDAFIVHTKLEKEWLKTKGICNKKIFLIRFPTIPQELLNYNIQVENLGDVLYLGRIVYRKGIHILIKALSIVKPHLEGIKATIAGPADQQYLNYLIELVEKYNLKNNISFIGFVKEEEKHRFIRSHKIFVLPSLKEYTPCVLLEAQALGVPVIATRVGAVPEMIIDRETGLLVEPNNEVELAKAIEWLLTNKTPYQYFSRKAREFVKDFTTEETVEKLERLYYDIISN
ncbi:MAG: glycosyltransferase family 4 protein [Thermofilum sp.]|nr:glycosyltransferase family 4 protein [Thermofilum sp.]